LTVKRADRDIGGSDVKSDDDDDDALSLPEPKMKIVTKAALAKKVMKKKIQSNQVPMLNKFLVLQKKLECLYLERFFSR